MDEVIVRQSVEDLMYQLLSGRCNLQVADEALDALTRQLGLDVNLAQVKWSQASYEASEAERDACMEELKACSQ